MPSLHIWSYCGHAVPTPRATMAVGLDNTSNKHKDWSPFKFQIKVENQHAKVSNGHTKNLKFFL